MLTSCSISSTCGSKGSEESDGVGGTQAAHWPHTPWPFCIAPRPPLALAAPYSCPPHPPLSGQPTHSTPPTSVSVSLSPMAPRVRT